MAWTCRSAAWAVLTLACASEAASAPRIHEVRVEGTRRVDPARVVRALTQKEGQPFDRSKTGDDLQAVWRLGAFSDVQASVEAGAAGEVAYVIKVTEAPFLREVKLEGDLGDAIGVQPNSFLNLVAVRQALRRVRVGYVDKGYLNAEVTYRLQRVDDTGLVDLVLNVAQHERVRVRDVRILGAKQLSPSEVAKAMELKPDDSVYTEDQLDRDLLLIQALYYDHGFINVHTEKALALSADQKWMTITVSVEEGDAYRLGKLSLKGARQVPEDTLWPLVQSRAGETFNRSRLAHDIQAMTELYQNASYANAQVTPDTRIDPDAKTIDVTFDVSEGKRAVIEQIVIAGNSGVATDAIRAKIQLREGEPFTLSGLEQAKRDVSAMGGIDSVAVSRRQGTDDQKVVLTFDVAEKPRSFQVSFDLSPWFTRARWAVIAACAALLAVAGAGIRLARRFKARRGRAADRA